MRFRQLTALLLAASLAGVTSTPAAADPDAQDIARALAALAIVGAAVAAGKTGGWDSDRYGDPFSPAEGVVCLPKPRQCYRNGHLSYRWTRRIFGA